MITIDDNFPLLNRLDLIIPIGITRLSGREPEITCYPELKDLALMLDKLPHDRLFERETLSLITKRASECPALKDYLPDSEHFCDLSYIYRLDSADDLCEGLITDQTVQITKESVYENLTDTEPDMLDDGALIFGTVENGRIVSVAFENPRFGEDDGGTADVGVETADSFTGKGYGKSNAAALCKALLGLKKSVVYIAQSSNIPSIKIAEAVGFSRYGYEFQLAMYKQQPDTL